MTNSTGLGGGFTLPGTSMTLHRIGYGAGHYDRTLAHLHKSKGFVAIGLAFSGQQVGAVPALQHDVPLDYVLTETKAFDFRSS